MEIVATDLRRQAEYYGRQEATLQDKERGDFFRSARATTAIKDIGKCGATPSSV